MKAGGDDVWLDAEVEQAEHAADRLARVDGAEDQVPGHAGLHGDARGLGVADFADEDNVGVLPQNAAEQRGEGIALGIVDGDLGDAFELDFDRVFDGDDVSLADVDVAEDGVERGGFA